MWRSYIAIAGVVLLATGWLFADVLRGGHVPGYRDAAHYYYPLFELVRDQWAAGRVPLWNPYDGTGRPLAADPTASVFYPGKLVFALPLDYGRAYVAYVVGHVIFAALAMFVLARRWGISPSGATIGALSYALGGSVLFQYANVIYLVGAAWLPLAILAAERMLAARCLRATIGLAAVLALIVLGGDAQLAYHVMLLAALYAVILWRREHRTETIAQRRSPTHDGRSATWWLSRPLFLAIAAVAALGLAAVQVLPTAQWTNHSVRTAASSPRSVYELLMAEPKSGIQVREVPPWYAGLLGARVGPLDADDRDWFSVGPWRWAELVWPNVGGRQFPVHQRLWDLLPAEGAAWVPSLYMGLLPLALALWTWRLCRADARVVWMSWCVVIALSAALGRIGLGWLGRELGLLLPAGDMTAGAAAWIGDGFGGLYWLMNVLLPGYAYFRYPAKWLVIAALGISVLAGIGWDRTATAPAARLRRGLNGLVVMSLCGLVVLAIMRPWWSDWLRAAPADPLFGPFNPGGAWRDLAGAFAQTALVALASNWFVTVRMGMSPSRRGRGQAHFSDVTNSPAYAHWPKNEPVPAPSERSRWLIWRRGSGSGVPKWLAAAAIGLVVFDLSVANRWMVVAVPESVLRGPAGTVEQSVRRHAPQLTDEAVVPPRIDRSAAGHDPAWIERGSLQRSTEIVLWRSESLFPRFHLLAAVGSVQVPSALSPLDYEVLLAVINPLDQHPLSVSTQIEPEDEPMISQVPNPLPRAWIVHDVEVVPPLANRAVPDVIRATVHVLGSPVRRRDLRKSAVVESTEAVAPAPLPPEANIAKNGNEYLEICRITRYEPDQVEIEAVLDRDGLVILNDYYDPGWKLTVTSDGAASRAVEIFRTNRIMRGAWLPAGRHQLVYRYEPSSFVWGAAVSGVAWSMLGLSIVLMRLANSSKRSQEVTDSTSAAKK